MDFLSAHAAGLEGLPDPEVLALAAEQDRILVTHDVRTMPRHFAAFVEARGSSPGVFLVKQRTPLADIIETLVLVWALSDAGEWKNRVLEMPLP